MIVGYTPQGNTDTRLIALPKTNGSPLKSAVCDTTFLLGGFGLFSGAFAVSFGGMSGVKNTHLIEQALKWGGQKSEGRFCFP